MEKVNVNQDICIGCGACQAEYPDVFEINDEGLAEVQNGREMQEQEEAEIMTGICPVGAIYSEEK
ncbi:MAG: ferredoxin [Bacilli bacterium]|jgi:ferredoxin|nr:ferredoxin [Bacilli bacterium]